MLSECFQPLKEFTGSYFESLLPIYLAGLTDRNDEVRNNAVYGLGEIVLYGEQASFK